MALDDFTYQELRSEAARLLSSLRQTIIIRFRGRGPVDFELVQAISMRIEGIRFLFNSLDDRFGSSHPDLAFLRNRLMTDLDALIDSDGFHILSPMRVRISSPGPASKKPSIIENYYGLHEASFREATMALHDIMSFILTKKVDIIENDMTTQKFSSDAVRRIVPEQKISPLKFYFDHGILKLQHQTNNQNPQDASNIENALEAIISQGNNLIENLVRSNCDRKILESIISVKSHLEDNSNIIKTALMNINCISIASQFDEEIPPAINGMIKGFTSSIYLYVTQFPEWEQFSENAANTEFDAEDVETILETADHLIENLSQRTEEIDCQVPKSITAIKEAINAPGKFSKRAAFALLRTLENLVAKVYQYSATFLDDTITGFSKSASSVVSKVAIVGLLSFTATSASQLSPVVSKIGEMNWMNEATTMIRRQLDDMKLGE